MTTEEWVDSAIRLLDVLVSWPVFAAVMLVVFREQVADAGRWLGRLIEKREVTASTPIGTITLKRLGKAEVARVAREAVGRVTGATRGTQDDASRIAGAVREFEQQLERGEMAEMAVAGSYRLEFEEAVPAVIVPAPDSGTRALILLRFGAGDELPTDSSAWVEASRLLTPAGGTGTGPALSALQLELISRADKIAAIREG